MDPKLVLCLLLLFSTQFIPIQAVKPYEKNSQPAKPSSGFNVHSVSAILSDRGYHAMSLTLDITLEAVLPTLFMNHNTTLTLFCPQDQGFFPSKYPQPPLTLLKYHVVPFKMDKESMEASFRHGSKVDTLLSGRPLVVTSRPGKSGYVASFNEVKVTEWNIYNDGRLIIHGVEDFFDPAFQTLRYPQYNVVIVKEDPSGAVTWLKVALEVIVWCLLMSFVVAFTCCLSRFLDKRHGDGEYAPLQ